MLPDKLRAAVIAHRMLQPGDVAVVGVSGGPDSVALFHALSALSYELGISLHVAHLDHMLRGSESAADADFVRDLAARLGWPATVAARDVAGLRNRYRLTVEEAGRWARYAFFAEVVRASGATGVVVGHTAADQVETVVLHWLRGAGLAGLRGMRPVTEMRLPKLDDVPVERVRILRPLLDVTRGEVEAYCREHALNPREDRTNRDRGFTRNRVRWELLPELRRFNAGFDDVMLRSARLAALDDDYLQSQAMARWPQVVAEHEGCLVYDLAKWTGMAPGLRYRLLREGAFRLQGNLYELSAVHLDNADRVLCDSPVGSVVHWPHGLRLIKQYSQFLLCREQTLVGSTLSVDGEELVVPGETVVGGGRWHVRATLLQDAAQHEQIVSAADVWHAHVDARATGTSLRVRRRWPGDRFQPLGMHMEKKLQDFLVDSKVPRARRDDVPLVVGGDGRIVWVVGLRIAEWARPRGETRQALCLRFDQMSK